MIKRLNIFLILLGMCFSLGFAQQNGNLENRIDSISYALGVDLGTNLSDLDLKLNSDMVYQGIIDGLAKKNNMSPQEVKALLQQFQQEANAAQKQKAIDKENAFLTENRSRDGMQETASGLQYLVLTKGTGPKPSSPTTKVRVHYEGRLLNGEVFDSSIQRGEPIEFELNRRMDGGRTTDARRIKISLFYPLSPRIWRKRQSSYPGLLDFGFRGRTAGYCTIV